MKLNPRRLLARLYLGSVALAALLAAVAIVRLYLIGLPDIDGPPPPASPPGAEAAWEIDEAQRAAEERELEDDEG